MLSHCVTGLVLVLWALLFAQLEITIEGKIGWARGADTWRKKSSLYGALMSGKELTGYHLVMFFLPYLFLHLPFVFAWNWGIDLFTKWRELEILAIFFALCVCWDFWWFILNPNYTLARFRRGEIWWHAKWIGRVPADYIGGAVLVLALTAAATYGDPTALGRIAFAIIFLVGGTLEVIILAPGHHRRYLAKKAKYQMVADDWARWLTDEEMADELADLKAKREIEERLAARGRLRAQREQLNIPKPNAA